VTDEAGGTDRDPDDEVRADRARRLLADPPEERRDAERAEDEPDQAADRTDEACRDDRGREVQRGFLRRRLCGTRTEQVEAEEEEERADHEPQDVRRQPPGGIPAAERAGHRGRQHPGDEAPVDASRPDVSERPRGRRNPGNGDVRASGGGRIPGHEQENREADVPEHEAEETPHERDEKAPHADSREDQCVHSLEYGR
jgi:hypothetical protein